MNEQRICSFDGVTSADASSGEEVVIGRLTIQKLRAELEVTRIRDRERVVELEATNKKLRMTKFGFVHMASLNGKMKFKYEDDDDDDDGYGDSSSLESIPTKIEANYPIIDDSEEDYVDEGFDSAEPKQGKVDVNLKNVLTGLIAIVTGSNKGLDDQKPPSSSSSNQNVSFLGSSVYIPSAPPLLEPNYSVYKDLLEAEPPHWLPDSSTTTCMHCSSPFTAITCGRHHCRFCGGIFCRNCSRGRCLMPTRFRERNPQRVCDSCYERLDPLQGVLINSISNAVQVAKHDVVDWTCTRGWLNLPIGLSMEDEIYKASNTLRGYSQVARSDPEKSIPHALLSRAQGLAILTVAKAGAFLSYNLGTGLVISRRSDGSWSAPSALLSLGLGWGAQVGGELMDFIIVLHDLKAVKTFCSRMHFSLGAGCSAAAGPIGRVLEADLRAGDRGSGLCYTYSRCKGAFVGLSLEGNVVTTRRDTNVKFYGDPYLSTSDILLGMVDQPRAAQPLYTALKDLYAGAKARPSVTSELSPFSTVHPVPCRATASTTFLMYLRHKGLGNDSEDLRSDFNDNMSESSLSKFLFGGQVCGCFSFRRLINNVMSHKS
ncbi:BnaCnng11930D [Brassica napus]|uniref:BnaCnng11930D protein n=1 Tax=Brassica napus TaxID=3708 RepID=A0A078I442_BRANA|nr:BnaCnng11930D [Brassica napus]